MMSNVRVYCEKITTLCPFFFNFSNNLSNITILPDAVIISSVVMSTSWSVSAPGKRYLEREREGKRRESESEKGNKCK